MIWHQYDKSFVAVKVKKKKCMLSFVCLFACLVLIWLIYRGYPKGSWRVSFKSLFTVGAERGSTTTRQMSTSEGGTEHHQSHRQPTNLLVSGVDLDWCLLRWWWDRTISISPSVSEPAYEWDEIILWLYTLIVLLKRRCKPDYSII